MTPRQHDERLLELVAARCSGIKCKTLAMKFQLSESYIRSATNRIKDADSLTACDAEGAYW